jgi:copper oxidase (laccase) domain-containing protein
VALCILTADCAPLALASPEGIFGAVHAGWRGLLGGVVEATVARMRGWGATDVSAALGPCIHASCYEFSSADLDLVEAAYGPAVRGATTDGRPALDLGAAVAAAVGTAGARMVAGVDICTACGGGQFSHRARADTGRQALLVWSTAPGEGEGS